MIILIDNYDSFTWNLYHFFGDLGKEVKVIRNDKATAEELLKLKPSRFIISPGPGYPSSSGISIEVVKFCIKLEIPLLGVCLGHQAIASALKGKIINAKNIYHGKISKIENDGEGIFKNLPNNFNATRYHSLVVEEKSLPDQFKITSRTENGTIMGIRHENKIIEGIQFHPESIATENGHKILNNFLSLKHVKI